LPSALIWLAWAHVAYTLYVILYDVPLFYAIWRLNPDR